MYCSKKRWSALVLLAYAGHNRYVDGPDLWFHAGAQPNTRRSGESTNYRLWQGHNNFSNPTQFPIQFVTLSRGRVQNASKNWTRFSEYELIQRGGQCDQLQLHAVELCNYRKFRGHFKEVDRPGKIPVVSKILCDKISWTCFNMRRAGKTAMKRKQCWIRSFCWSIAREIS